MTKREIDLKTIVYLLNTYVYCALMSIGIPIGLGTILVWLACQLHWLLGIITAITVAPAVVVGWYAWLHKKISKK